MARDYFELDLNHLDTEWVEQPRWYSEVAHKLAAAIEDHAVLKARVEVVWAELDQDVRSNPMAFGIEKIREESVRTTIILQPRYQEVVSAEIKAKRIVNDLEADRDTLEHRKRALEKAVDLRLSHYYAEPKMSEKAATAHRENEVAEGFAKKKTKGK